MDADEILELNAQLIVFRDGYRETLAAIELQRADLKEVIRQAVALDVAIAARFETCEKIAASFAQTLAMVNKLGAKYVERERARVDPADAWKLGRDDDDYGNEP